MMRLSFGQELRQVQKQILAPRMIQSMEILQLPIMALQERLERELQENPLLELREDEPEPVEESAEPVAEENPDAPTSDERELVVDETKDNADDFERLLNSDPEWLDSLDERPRASATRLEEEEDRQHDAMANTMARPQTLADYLRDQLAWFDLDDDLRLLCEKIIYSLDGNGYLPCRLEDLLDPRADQEERKLIQRALEIVQKLDPLGVGARDLRECLLLQLKPGQSDREELETLIRNHLEDVAGNRLPQITKKTGWSLERLKELLGELHRLNPKPAASFAETPATPVVPDVFVDVAEGGQYRVYLNDGRIPNLFISPYYRKLLLEGKATDAEKDWIKRKFNSAQWLIESIEQRRNTLTRVAQAIVDHQTEFLNRGPEAVEPLKMQQIAEKVGVHVTTVSRAVDDKWIQTPRGIYPLKRFFVGGTVSADGEEVAWDAIRQRLREIVDHEDKRSPYSDDELVVQLKKHGLTVARRTVTKYRKALDIPSSRQRREWTEAPAADDAATADDAPAAPDGAPDVESPAAAATDDSPAPLILPDDELQGADLTGCDLTDVLLTGGDLTEAELVDLAVAQAFFTRPKVKNYVLTDQKLTVDKLTDQKLTDGAPHEPPAGSAQAEPPADESP